jgi:hypothetical protein
MVVCGCVGLARFAAFLQGGTVMQQIIDVDSDVSDFASGLANAGVETVIRYYNNNNTSTHPSKCLTRPELKAWHDAGLSVAVVFEQRGGAAGDITDLTKETGTRDAQRALDLATLLEQPERSAIYLSDDFASLCARLRVPYLDVFDLVAASDIWAREIAAGDGVHPNEGGYAMIGDAVENWAGWRAWIDRAASS